MKIVKIGTNQQAMIPSRRNSCGRVFRATIMVSVFLWIFSPTTEAMMIRKVYRMQVEKKSEKKKLFFAECKFKKKGKRGNPHLLAASGQHKRGVGGGRRARRREMLQC